jgi:hypothetical protein
MKGSFGFAFPSGTCFDSLGAGDEDCGQLIGFEGGPESTGAAAPGQVETPIQLVLPLFDEASGADDEAAPQVAPGDQLLDQEARHDRLAGARVVGQQKPQRLPGEHGLVDGGDLVGRRIDQRGVDRQDGIEQMGQADAMGFRDQPEQGAVAVEAPGRPASTISRRGSSWR